MASMVIEVPEGLKALDRPSVMIGGARYTKVGRCEANYYTMAGAVVVERSLYARSVSATLRWSIR